MERRGRLFWGKFADERGTNLLEMALLTPVLLLLLLGIIEVGRYAEISVVVANAAHAGAQYGAQNLITAADTTGIQNAAVMDTQNVLTASQITSSPLCGCAGDSLGTCSTTTPTTCTPPNHPLVYVQVTATGTFNSLFGYPGIPSSITVNRTAQMPVAQ